MQTNATELKSETTSTDADLMDLLIILAKHKKLIFLFPLIAAIVMAGVTMTLPNIYKASTKLLPPQQAQSSASALLSQLGGVAAAVGGSGMKNPNDLYIGMLRSRTISDQLAKKFNLMSVYQTNSAEKVRNILAENTMITSGKEGLITIEVEDKDRKLVSSLANGYVEELLKLTKVLAVTEAGQRRMFFERQLEISKNNLEAAEKTLKGALDTHGVISVDSDSRVIVETIGRLRAQVSAKQIQLASMQAFVTENNQDYKRAQEELTSLRSELYKLENGRPETAAQQKGNDNPVGLQNIKILRDLKYNQMLHELLSKQYEMARLDEAKDVSVIQVLDTAIEPENKVKPARLSLVVVATVLALFAAISWAFLSELKERGLRVPARAAKWQRLKSYLRLR
ncbi:Wzz/FepE/Etk N-terminal domain-containing protein [Janthinobacterium sp. PC23-8]|uniref:GumC family protein n=1 Tax=Janthinobacterium sp. PC23-8 TaxID=2012679 RepID=UPI0020CDEB97|nr:Wzz/FepE/Etk N-terminal domain-containing protein [Janthinobacterium sp. PC23-8]